jgi:hypothetical protein
MGDPSIVAAPVPFSPGLAAAAVVWLYLPRRDKAACWLRAWC